MPTKNPRLTITLNPSLSVQLREISRLTGNSQSSVISQLLEGSHAVFDRIIAVLLAADSAKRSLRGNISQQISSAQTEIEQQLGLFTPLSNRGVRSGENHSETVAGSSAPVTPNVIKVGGGRHGAV